MNAEERQRQMDFLLQQQATHDHEIAQIRRILLSAIRIGRRDRTDFREKLNALINAQIRGEEETSKLRAETDKFQAETSKFQTETSKFRAETSKFQAETRKFQAETRKFQAETSKFQAETGKFKDETSKFQNETSKFQAETGKFQAETRQAFSVLTKSVGETIDRVDELEDSHGNGRPTN